ncbi:S8 family serine peptidase [Agromyces albus]|uniref:S8 family serine peptidase n=1 Tax=Agromyces albus TaxID=205332 RepID=UPI002788C51A|nr:S8 family serine peptidase [Agromyces albus]MDQ0577046.1 subtilisin family serine protease [Agromyces albus]
MPGLRSLAATSTLALALTALVASPAGAITSADSEVAGEQQYVVLFAEGASESATRAAVEAAGGTIVAENTEVGVATVVTTDSDFAAQAAAQSVIEGTALNRVIADVPEAQKGAGAGKKLDSAKADLRSAGTGAAAVTGAPATRPSQGKPIAEPLADLQWDMQAIGATVDGSYRHDKTKGVLVGIIDTGVDGSHPDIAPNFDAELSRNFTVDIEVDANGDPVDGPCADEPDQSCEDAADVDENGHGTHVASTIGSPINGIGIAGVAPDVTLVNLRAAQDSGYFFLQASVDALTYAGDVGIDVVNMSYYVDPWLFNCTSHPADSAEDQAEQQTIITAMQRALDYARDHGVTLVSAAGNGATDYTKAISDSSSPDFASEPGEVAYTRDLLDPASCISMPSEGEGVITVSSTGQSDRKAYYSDYGNGYVDVAAPGGDVYDNAEGTRQYPGGILAAYPAALAEEEGAIDENGDVVVPWAVKNCDASGETCAYYQYLQGTSMASPHAAGVAALIVGQYGKFDKAHGGTTLSPAKTESILLSTAVDTACPDPAAFTYVRHLPTGATATTTHTCEGGPTKNGFFGDGIVNALAAIGR